MILITTLINYNSLFAGRKVIAASLQLCETNDSFGKGFHMLKAHMLQAHMLNCLMTGWSPRKSLSYGRSSTRFFSKIASIFLKEVLHFKDLNHHLDYTDVSFNPKNGAFSIIKKSDTQTDRQTK